jgi:hypothetical protein
VVRCLSRVLERCGPAFVRVVLGIFELEAAGSAKPEAVAKRKRAAEELDADRDGDGENDLNGGSGDSSGRRVGVLARATGQSGTPVPGRKAPQRLGRVESLLGQEPGAVAARITPSTHGSGGRSGGRKASAAVIVVDLRDQLSRVDKRLVTMLFHAWMRCIRYLDNVSGVQPVCAVDKTVVQLTHLLGAFLSAFLDHLRPQDCEVVLSDAADAVHEYILRCNTASWSPVLRMSESLFAFLESRQNESSA